MTNSEFVYTTYIKSTPQKVWQAITTPEFQKQYWSVTLVSDWKKGSKWHEVGGTCAANGEIVEVSPPAKLVMTWAHFGDEAQKAPPSRVTFNIEQLDELVRLTVTHDRLLPGSETLRAISGGWPFVLSSLKSMLETSQGIDIKAIKAKTAAAG